MLLIVVIYVEMIGQYGRVVVAGEFGRVEPSQLTTTTLQYSPCSALHCTSNMCDKLMSYLIILCIKIRAPLSEFCFVLSFSEL
jgi:hypothetical protein